MKKLLVSCVFVLAAIISAMGQGNGKGTVIVDGSIGFPNLLSGILRTVFAEDISDSDIRFSSFGPAEGRIEFMVGNRIGLGLMGNYAASEITYFADGDNGNRYKYVINVPRYRVMPRVNFHFSQGAHVDGYLALAVGYVNFRADVETDDPDYDVDAEEEIENEVFGTIGGRFALGARFYVTKAVGAHVELGFGGGGLINVGLTARFGSK